MMANIVKRCFLVFSIILIIVLIRLVFIHLINFKSSKCDSINQIERIFRISFINEYSEIKDIDITSEKEATYIKVFLQVRKDEIEYLEYYKNPSSSNIEKYYSSDIIYLSNYRIEEKNILYKYTIFSEYTVNKFNGVQNRPFPINVYMIESTDESTVNILLSSIIPYRLDYSNETIQNEYKSMY